MGRTAAVVGSVAAVGAAIVGVTTAVLTGGHSTPTPAPVSPSVQRFAPAAASSSSASSSSPTPSPSPSVSSVSVSPSSSPPAAPPVVVLHGVPGTTGADGVLRPPTNMPPPMPPSPSAYCLPESAPGPHACPSPSVTP